MSHSALTGTRIRERRIVLGLKQAELARSVGISASYLNLIEHNRRRIGGKLLVDIARGLAVDLSALTEGAQAQLLEELGEAAAEHPDVASEVDRADELVGRFPGWAALVAAQHRSILSLERKTATLAERVEHDPFLSEALHDVLSKVTSIRSTASILAETPDLDEPWLRRFHNNLSQDSEKLTDSSEALVTYLDSGGEIEPGLATPQEEMEAWLDARDFHLAELETGEATPVDLVEEAETLRSSAARAMALDHLRQYQTDAERMPLSAVTAAAQELGFDPARLSRLFGVDLPAAMRRLAGLPRAYKDGPRIGLLICDGAGALVLRKATEKFPLPRFSAACPLWPLYQALSRPVTPVRAALNHVSAPSQRFLSYAIAQPRAPIAFSGPQVLQSYMLLVPEALVVREMAELETQSVGASCRICAVPACPARREPSILAENFDTPTPSRDTVGKGTE
ncbi:MAG: short-chain fatty acyl-CoA regulator family protein [Pseudomonadota bacterium]